jgi:Fic family protein
VAEWTEGTAHLGALPHLGTSDVRKVRLQSTRYDGASHLRSYLHYFRRTCEMVENAVGTGRRLADMLSRDRSRIQQLGRIAGSALQVHQSLQTRPITTLASLAAETYLTMPTVTKAVQALADKDIVKELTGRRRGRVYCCREYMAIMNEGTAHRSISPST